MRKGILNYLYEIAKSVNDSAMSLNAMGPTNEAAAGTDTAQSGLNGRLQRIAQNLTTLINKFTGTAAADFSRLPVSLLDGLQTSGSITSAATIFMLDMLNYSSVSVQITNAGTGCIVIYESSEDQVTWQACAGLAGSQVGSLAAVTTTAGVGLYVFSRRGRYFRIRVSVYGSGTVAVTASQSCANAVVSLSASVQGNINEGVATTGSPVTVGFEARTSSKTSVSTGQAVRSIGTLDGRQIMRPHAIPENEWSYAAAAGGILNTTAAVTIKAAAGAGVRNYLTGLQVMSDVLTNATELVIRDGAAGTVIFRTKLPTAGVTGTLNIQFQNPLKSTANTLLEVATLTASGAGAVFINAQGYIAP